MHLQRLSVEDDSDHAKLHHNIVRNDIAVCVDRPCIHECTEYLDALINDRDPIEQGVNLIHEPDDKKLDALRLGTCGNKVDKRCRYCRICRIPLHNGKIHLRRLECRKGQHDPVRIQLEIRHLERACVHQNLCLRKQRANGFLHLQSLCERHLAGCGNRDKQGFHMGNPIQCFLRLFRFALCGCSTGNNIRQLLHRLPPSKHMQTRPPPGMTHSPYFPEIGGMCPLSHIHFELHVYLA